jgi:hypothetical protein
MRTLILSMLILTLLIYIGGCIDQQREQIVQNDQDQGVAPPGAPIPGMIPGPGPGVNIKQDTGKKTSIGEPRQRNLEWGASMLIPDGWNTKVFPACTGLVTIDGSNAARSVIFLNGLHQSVDPLPPGVTPEDYVEKYMQKDFTTVSDVKIIKYEDADISALRVGGANVKAMRVSFKNNGIPAIGSFTVNTYGWSGSSAVGYVWGITSTEGEFETDGGTLLTMFKSIKYEEATIEECKKAQKEAWNIKD